MQERFLFPAFFLSINKFVTSENIYPSTDQRFDQFGISMDMIMGANLLVPVQLYKKHIFTRKSRVPNLFARGLDEIQTSSNSTTLLCYRIIAVYPSDIILVVVIRNGMVVVVSIDRQECETWIQWCDCLWPAGVLAKAIVLSIESANMIPLCNCEHRSLSYRDSNCVSGLCRIDDIRSASEVLCIVIGQVDDGLRRHLFQGSKETCTFPHTACSRVF